MPSGHIQQTDLARTQGTIPAPVRENNFFPKPKPREKTETYSVIVNKVSVHDLLFALARDAKLNVDIHPNVVGLVTLNAIDQTLPQLLTRIAKQVDVRFELTGPNLAIMPDSPFLKTYLINYVNMAREVSGTVATNTQILTSGLLSADTGSAPSANGNVSHIEIRNTSKNQFWASLEKNIKELLLETDKVLPAGSTETFIEQERIQIGNDGNQSNSSSSKTKKNADTVSSSAKSESSGSTVIRRSTFREAASVICHPESGVIMVRASGRQHEKVQEFVDQVMGNAKRQVLIEATIVEVLLSDAYQQGIDWNRLRADGSGFGLSAPSLGTNVNNAATPFIFKYLNASNPLNLALTVDLLQSFGTTKVLSSPKLSVLNNQTATLKVSEEFVYFLVKSDISTSTLTSAPITSVTTSPQSVSVGLFMSVTPQISEAGFITLNVRPSISSISDLKQDPNPSIPASVKNYVPQIRTREIESVMRVESGDIAVLGGLMEDSLDNSNGRIPGLGAIPIFGELFNHRANTSKKSELLIFLRPTIIKEANIAGDYREFKSNLPKADFYAPQPEFQPFHPSKTHSDSDNLPPPKASP